MSVLRSSRKEIEIIWAILLVTIAANAALLRKRSFNVTTVNSTDLPDDFNIYIPYQGQKYNRFDWSLLQNMARNKSGNLLISPISLKLALVLLYEGAQDQTAQELATVLNLPVGKTATRQRYSSIFKSLQEKKPEYSLLFGSRVYVDKSVTINEQYADITTSVYNTEVINANFSDFRVTAKDINDYVSNVTEGHIPKIIDKEENLNDTLMLIVNGLFFKGTWYHQPFSVNDTKISEFYVTNNETVQVPCMRTTRKFYYVYADSLNAKILRLPYAGDKYSMFLMLPQQKGTLDDLLKNISPYIINRYEWLMQELPVDLILPKFKFDFTSHMEDTLRQLGIREIFDNTATLTGILRTKSTSRRLEVSDIIQKAGIEVNEYGTTAYAASEIEIGNKMSSETFHATHPFLFYIEDESSGTILYIGVVNNPLEETGMVKPLPVKSTSQTQPLPPPPQQQPQLELHHAHEVQSDPTSAAIAIATGPEERQNYFNVELLQRLNEAQPDNVLVGTASVKAALMVLAEAAAGRTRDEILSSLRLPSSPAELRKAANLVSSMYKDQSGTTELQTAIKLWLGNEIAISKNFTDVLYTHYKGDIELISFNNVSSAVRNINDWVKKYTHGRINSIADPSSITSSTKLLLTTAVYFKGAWLNAFDKSYTQNRCFNVPHKGCRETAIMENVATYKYAYIPAINAEVVQIPYTGGRMGMLVLLPKTPGVSALSDLSRDVAFTPISLIRAALQDTELLLQLPRFSIHNKINMHNALSKLRIRDVFGDKANFSAAFPDQKVRVGAFMHQAQIEVSEEGTIAAAVSDVVVVPLIGSTITTFRADRPFLFFLIDFQTNGILFAGRYFQPDASPAVSAAKHH